VKITDPDEVPRTTLAAATSEVTVTTTTPPGATGYPVVVAAAAISVVLRPKFTYAQPLVVLAIWI
jgi:hypothetical protein